MLSKLHLYNILQVSITFIILPTVSRTQEFEDPNKLLSNNWDSDSSLMSSPKIVLPIISFVILFLALCYSLRETCRNPSIIKTEHSTRAEIKPHHLLFQESQLHNLLCDWSSHKESSKSKTDNEKNGERVVVPIPMLLSQNLFVTNEDSTLKSDTLALLRVESSYK